MGAGGAMTQIPPPPPGFELIPPPPPGFERVSPPKRTTASTTPGVKRDVPGWGAAALGVGDVLAAGFFDEIAAGLDAADLGISYREALANRRGQQDAALEQHPGLYLGGGLAGGLATAPLQPFMRASTMTGKVAGGLASGGLFGATYGFGSGRGDDPASGVQDRLRRAGEGGLLGGTFGAIAPYAVPMLFRPLGRGVGNVASRIVPRTLAKRAARRVDEALRLDDKAAAGKSFAPVRPGQSLASRAPQLRAAEQEGQPTILADTGGGWTRALMRSAANTSPEGRTQLEAATSDRFASQAERARRFASRLFGTRGDTAARRESLERAARQANDPAYRAAEAAAPAGIWTDRIATLTQSDYMQRAMKQAMPAARTDAALRGEAPGSIPRNPFYVGRDGALHHRTMPDGSRAIPNLRYWDQVQRKLRDAAEEAARKGRKHEAGQIRDLRRELLEELDGIVPQFRSARRGAAAFFGAEDALEAGQLAARNVRMNNQELLRGYRQLKPAEQALFREGFANEIVEELGNIRNGRNVLGASWWSTPKGRERVGIIFGERQAREWEAFGRLEKVYNLTRHALGNSSTVRQLVEMGLAGGAASWFGTGMNPLDYSTWSPEGFTAFLLGAGARRGFARISEKTSREVARLLASGSADDIQKAADLVAGNPGLMVALRNADDLLGNALPRVGVLTGPRLGGVFPVSGEETER